MEDNNKIENEELPMNWWNFLKYFRFPVGIFFSIYNFIGSLSIIKDIQLNMFGNALLLINVLLIIFLCVTFYYFVKRKKYGFEMIITCFIVEIIYNSFINVFSNNNGASNSITEMVIEVLIVVGILCAVWVYPNYIYFKKRRHLFGDGEEKKDKNEEETRKIVNIDDNNEKIDDDTKQKKEEKEIVNPVNNKFCTKCGKQIENEWTFCNYCGNKLK